MTTSEQDALRVLEELLPAGIVVADPDVIASYARDQSRFTDFWPSARRRDAPHHR